MRDLRSAHDTLAVGKAAKGGNPDLHMRSIQSGLVCGYWGIYVEGRDREER